MVVVWCRKRIFDNRLTNWEIQKWLWFGVEKGYLTTIAEILKRMPMLWFGVEKGYLTTKINYEDMTRGCGLV